MISRTANRFFLAALLGLVCSVIAHAGPKTELPIPKSGAYVGFQIDSSATNPGRVNQVFQVESSLFGDFFRFPHVVTDTNDRSKLRSFLAECAAVKSVPVLTMETVDGLGSYTRKHITTLARELGRTNGPVLIVWNHEMNGSWFPWGQRPKEYIKKFREFSRIAKKRASNISLVWAPNQAWGYPWSGRTYTPPSLEGLDTNGDGALTAGDDPYLPFYPGNKFVDWIGLSFYHRGNGVADARNEAPASGKFAAGLGHFGGIMNFHKDVAEKLGKPVLITETGAFFESANKNNRVDSEEDIKTSWLTQIYSLNTPGLPSLNRDFPLIKGLLWFERKKFETDISSEVDWTLSSNPSVTKEYQRLVASPYFIKRIETPTR